MSSFDCRIDIPSLAGLADKTLTVGREFYLECTGDWPKAKESWQLILPETEKYSLKLLSFQMKDLKTADLKVVSYTLGKHQLDQLKISDGTQTYDLSPQQFEVISVQDPADPKKEPFGPMGPLSLSWPMIYWLLLAGATTLILTISSWIVWQKSKRRRWLEEIRQYDHALSPISQFHSELRKLHRTYSFLNSRNAVEIMSADKLGLIEFIDRLVRVYLVRDFQFNALSSSDRSVLQGLKKFQRGIYAATSENMRKWLREIRKTKQDLERISQQDLRQIVVESRQLVEKFYEEKQNLNNGGS